MQNHYIFLELCSEGDLEKYVENYGEKNQNSRQVSNGAHPKRVLFE